MSDTLKQFDHYLNDDGAAALVIREHLVPVEGADGVVFPATFAAGDGFPGGYNIDGDPVGTNVCLIDTVGSQANRIEPLFAGEKYKGLVPKILIKAGEKQVDLLEAGHRAGDAIVRCCPELKTKFHEAFEALLQGDAEPLAKIAPTSLVFGVWDSRDTQAKLPRLIASTLRAYDVRELTRSAVYVPPVAYSDEGLLEEPSDLRDAEGKVKGKHPFAQRGFVHNPASASHGGVIAKGGIRRDATLGLVALRLLRAGNNTDKTRALQRYILGISLTAFTYSPIGYLRQGCILVLDPDKKPEFVEVHHDGKRKAVTLAHDTVLTYAKAAAKAFEVGEDKSAKFDPELAKQDLAGDGKAKKAKKTK